VGGGTRIAKLKERKNQFRSRSGCRFPCGTKGFGIMTECFRTGFGESRGGGGGSKGGARASRSGDGRSPGRCRRHETENLLVEILTLIL